MTTAKPLKKVDWSTTHRRALTAPEIVARLSEREGWVLFGDGSTMAIEKTFNFTSFYQTMAFINAVALIAHTQDHHPDMVVESKRCVIRFNTHDVGGISITDFDCAARCDALLT